MPRPLIIALSALIAAMALAAPASSSANVYCVNKPPCLGGTNAQNPQAALSQAQLHLGPDTVLIGPQADPYVGPFSYTGSDPVTIIGSGTGSGATILTAPAGTQPTLTLKDPESTVSNLRIEVVTGPSTGLDLEGTATGVRVQEQVDDDEIGPALGVFLAGGAVFEEGSVSMGDGEGIASADPGNYAFVHDSWIRSREGNGIWSVGKLSVTRSTVESASTGIDLISADAVAELGDTVVRTSDGSALAASYGATVTARHLTLLNDGGAQPGIVVGAGIVGNAAPTNLTLISSIVSGFPTTLLRRGVDPVNLANANLRYSAWDGDFEQSGNGSITNGPGNLEGTTPAFVQRTSLPPTIVSNLHLVAPSPLIDAADPAAPPIDHDGAAREQDGDGDGIGRSDIGAFENAPPPPPSEPPPSNPAPSGPAPGAPTPPVDLPPGAAAKDRVAPRLSAVSLSSRRLQLGSQMPQLVAGSRGTQIRFTLSEPAQVTLRFAPVRKGASGRSPLTLVVDAKAGSNRLRFAGRISPRKQLSPGRHVLALTAVDAAGNRSSAKVVRKLELIR